MRQVYKYLYNCLKKYKLLLFMLVLVGLFWGLMETLLPYLLKTPVRSYLDIEKRS